MSQQPHLFAVIGAGISGLSCARALCEAGHQVVVFDKGRGPGGRVSTRRRDEERYDHGAQYFTARTERFETEVQRWAETGIVAPWKGRFASWSTKGFEPHTPSGTRWVGIPTMSRIAQHLAGGLDVRTSTRIASMQRRSDGWFLLTEEAERTGPFSHVIVTVPGPQAAALLPAQTECHAVAQRLKYAPCWAVMARFAEPVSLPYDGVVLDGHPLRWIARDSSKPERASGERWVLHATPHWSENTIEQTPDHVAQQARVFTQTLLGARPVELVAHRWRYALSLQTDTPEGIYEPEHGLALCGDGMGQARVEGAFMSGLRMATRLLSTSC